MQKSHSDFKASTGATCFDVFDVLKWHSSTSTVKYKFKPPAFFVRRLERSQGLLSLVNILELFNLTIIYPHLIFFCQFDTSGPTRTLYPTSWKNTVFPGLG